MNYKLLVQTGGLGDCMVWFVTDVYTVTN